jgi:hypothetical protein
MLSLVMSPLLMPPLFGFRTMKDKGWNRVTPQELVGILESAGAIRLM